ncbi:FG-GAP repeat domain-containing protein [Glycomyces harbinensis]|uniref:Repeat domain-containing protein n=1 Tax=Glycomyces harbinensis TaxID=58114 RepID=A0A1G6YL92_9ACTN|nr:VCBS repeat-containing protein [Glycomyces harbinensis]SDD91274.1 Repeat domain-containing protein [Glycomyces harbinensis]
MNQSSRPKRRVVERIAASAAMLFGAALLASQAAVPAHAAVSAGDHYDYNGDGFQDLYMVRKSDGHLLFSAGNGAETLPAPVSRGSGWAHMDIAMAGDLTEDGTPDLLARDARTGDLYSYPGDGSGGFETRIPVGGGWNTMVAFSAAGDFDGDGHLDLYAVRKSDGQLYFHPGRGDGTFGARSLTEVDEDLGTGWAVFDGMTTVDHGYGPVLLLHSYSSGYYLSLHSDGEGGFDPYPSYTAGSLYSSDDPTRFSQVVAAGDRNEDGNQDFIAIGLQSGELLLLEGDGYGNGRYKTRLANNGNAYRLPASAFDHTYDYDQDYTADLYTVRTATPTDLSLYPGTGTGFFGPRRDAGFLIDGMNLVESAGDLNGDEIPDLLVRYTDGILDLHTGNNAGGTGFGQILNVGRGWNSMSAIVSGHDFNGDGKTDIVAREKSTGYLWLYPGNGEGRVGTRVKIGTGWNAMREITSVGDLDHDGHADVIAIRSSDNCMYFYGGRGNGTVKPGVKKSCNWVGYDQAAAVGDFNGDGHADWIARRKSDGALYLYKGDGAGGYGTRTQNGTGWNSIKFIA